MSAKEIARAKKAGKDWIHGELTSTSFLDYAFDQIMEAEAAPERHWLVRDKKTAMQAARNMLKDYAYDMWRAYNESDLLGILREKSQIDAFNRPKEERHELLRAFTRAAGEVLEQESTKSWLADEIEILAWSLAAAKTAKTARR